MSNTTYSYWNILTYHAYINPKEMKESITFVEDFANNTNQKLLKKLFIDIQKMNILILLRNLMLKMCH